MLRLQDLFPSMASFFFWQFVQRNGPSHGLDTGVIKWSLFTDKPSPEGWSARQTAQRWIPEFVSEGTLLPSLHFKKTKNLIKYTQNGKIRTRLLSKNIYNFYFVCRQLNDIWLWICLAVIERTWQQTRERAFSETLTTVFWHFSEFSEILNPFIKCIFKNVHNVSLIFILSVKMENIKHPR